MPLEPTLQRAFKCGLNLPQEIDYLSLEFAKTSHWDSIGHLQLISAIEREFNIMIETSDVLAISSYSEALQIVKKYVPS